MKKLQNPVLKTTSPLKVVVDTCVILNAAGSKGEAAARQAQAALQHAQRNGTIVYSHPCMSEWFLLATRADIVAQIFTPTAAWNIASLLKRTGQMFAPTEKVDLCADRDDNKWLALSQAAQASVLLTEDFKLLTLHSHAGTQIMRVGEYLRSYAHCQPKHFMGIALKGEVAPHDTAYGRRRARLLGQQKAARL
jgi:putative PIN family toxin of toxin-antitoxin system